MFLQWLKDRTILERILTVNMAIIILMSVLGIITLNHFNRVVHIGKKIEDHPLVVGNAVLEIGASVSDLSGDLKTAMETRSTDAIATYNRKLSQLDPAIQANFSLIESQYLGDQTLPPKVKASYLEWKGYNAKLVEALSGAGDVDSIKGNSQNSWQSRDLMNSYLTEINLFAYSKTNDFIKGLQGERRGATSWTILFILVAAALAIGLSVLVGRTVAIPIRLLQGVMRKLADGDLDVELPNVLSDRFEAGAIAKAAAEMKANAEEKNALLVRADQARIRAEKANQAKSRFLAMMSHELRTPMNAILGSAQVLDAMELDAEIRESVDTLTTGGETLMAILNDVLDLSKIESGKLSVECADFDLNELLEQTKALWLPRANDKDLMLNFEIEGTAPQWIHSDTTRIRQILFNLLSNAIKFTKHGQIDVKLRQTGTIDGKAQLEISVTDSGIGVDAEQIERLFNPFEQEDSTITRRFGGTGLGLSISRQLASLLGGSLEAISKKGQGSTFTLQFCAAICDAPAEKPADKTKKTTNKQQLSILVAEDNAINIKVLRALLKPFPYELVHAENGAIALDFLEHRRFDLVLMDIQMPVLDGIGATQKLRASDGPNKDVPIIAMTANAMQGDRESYFEVGMSGYVPKPIDARQLYAAIAAAAALGRSSGDLGAKKLTTKVS